MPYVQAPLDTCLDSPLLASLSVHGLHFTVCAPSMFPKANLYHSGLCPTALPATNRGVNHKPHWHLRSHKATGALLQGDLGSRGLQGSVSCGLQNTCSSFAGKHRLPLLPLNLDLIKTSCLPQLYLMKAFLCLTVDMIWFGWPG